MTPLAGLRIVVTRARHQAGELTDALRNAGADPVLFPTIEIAQVDDLEPVDRAARRIGNFDWIVFTSGNAVTSFLARLSELDIDWPSVPRVAAVGSGTCRALEQEGVAVDAIPEEFVGENLAPVMGDLKGRSVLLPRGDLARRKTAEALLDAGADVHSVVVYRTVTAHPDEDAMDDLRRGVDVLTFTSPSTVRNFLRILGDEGRDMASRVLVASIGPSTSAEIRASGLEVGLEAEPFTTGGLVSALIRWRNRDSPC